MAEPVEASPCAARVGQDVDPESELRQAQRTGQPPSSFDALFLLSIAAILVRAFLNYLPSASLSRAPRATDWAIPVLMANDPVLDQFRIYFYGQDRFGAWPWLLMSAVGQRLDIRWTADSLYTLQFAYVVCGLVAFAYVARESWRTAAFAFALLLATERFFRSTLLEISHPYGWQFSTIFIFWTVFRWLRMRERLSAPSLAAGVLVLASLAFLGQWTAPSSLFYLTIMVAWELLAARASRPGSQQRVTILLIVGSIAIALGAICHNALHAWTLTQASIAGFSLPITDLSLVDPATWQLNALAWFRKFWSEPGLRIAGPLFVFSLAIVAGSSVLSRRNQTADLPTDAVEKWGIALPLAVMAIGSAGVLVTVRWFVENEFDPRHLPPLSLTLVLSATLIAARLGTRAIDRLGVRSMGYFPLVGLCLAMLTAFAVFVATGPVDDSDERIYDEPAIALTAQGFRSFAADYEIAYAIAARSPSWPLTPVLIGGIGQWPGEDRTPWTIRSIENQSTLPVVFSYPGPPELERPKLLPLRGSLFNRKQLLRRQSPNFEIYEYELAPQFEPIPVKPKPSGPSIDLCWTEAKYDIEFEEVHEGPLLVVAVLNRHRPEVEPDTALQVLTGLSSEYLPTQLDGVVLSAQVPTSTVASGIRLLSDWDGSHAYYEGCHIPAVGVFSLRN